VEREQAGTGGLATVTLLTRAGCSMCERAAQQLAGLIGGSRTSGKLFVQFVHNDKNTSKNSTTARVDPLKNKWRRDAVGSADELSLE